MIINQLADIVCLIAARMNHSAGVLLSDPDTMATLSICSYCIVHIRRSVKLIVDAVTHIKLYLFLFC